MAVCARSQGDADQRAKPLLAAYKQSSADEQNILLTTVGRVGGSEALKIIEAAIASNDSAMHGLGIRAICNWPDATITSRLLELANADKHDSHRLSAFRAMIRVAPLDDETRTDIERVELLKKAMSMATRYEEQFYILDRARTIHDIEALRFVAPYMEKPIYVERACLSVVELAHFRDVRTPSQEEFDKALDRVIELSKDEVVVDRARRYKIDETWYRPANPAPLPMPPKGAVLAAGKSQKQENAEQGDADQENANQDNAEPEKAESEKQNPPWWIIAIVIAGCVLVVVCWRLTSKR